MGSSSQLMTVREEEGPVIKWRKVRVAEILGDSRKDTKTWGPPEFHIYEADENKIQIQGRHQHSVMTCIQ